MRNLPTIISEVKTCSPFWYTSERSWDDLFVVAESVGDILSIHTDPRWWWDFDLISKAKRLTKKPILAKWIHESDEQIVEAVRRWAQHVLVVGRIPEVHLGKCLIEVESLDQLREFSGKLLWDTKFVWNSRNLDTGWLNAETFDEAREIFSGWLCQASNIRTIEDIDPSANAVLVGTHLETFKNSLENNN